MSIRLIPNSIARRRTAIASEWSAGSPQMPAPVSRIVPNPSRRTGMSPPIKNIPLASAGRALDGREDCAVALIVLVSFINFIFYLDSSCPLLGSHSTSVGLFNATGDGIRTPSFERGYLRRIASIVWLHD